MAAEFFDLDGTLLLVNSARLWLARERRLGRVSARQLVRAGLMLASYHVGLLDMEEALRSSLTTLRGVREDFIRDETRRWWADEVRRFAAPGARAVLERHRAEGDHLVLLTSSSRYAAEMAIEEWDLDDALFQPYALEAGLFTGEPVLPLCFGPGKVVAAQAWAGARGIDLARCSFYTDSSTDLPMLAAVGRPHAVGPDPRLRLAARTRGWPVLDWSR